MTTTQDNRFYREPGAQPADGGPAFPGPDQQEVRENIHEGMTLRDYFAAKAMQGLLCANSVYSTSSYSDELSARAYQIADAMLKARG